MKLLLLFILLSTYKVSFAQLSSYDLGGYVKYLFSSTKYPFASERYDDYLIHARLNTAWYPSENIKAVMELRFRAYYGESVENIPDFKDQIKSKHEFLNLDTFLWKRKKSLGYGEIDRLYLDGNFDKLQVTVGRERIAWGTSWVWNPTDIFNPLSILDFDYEERPAVDAIRIQYYTGALSKIEAAVSPAKNKENSIAAGLYSFNKWNYDFNFIAGVKKEKWLTGFSWTGDIYGAGFRGEFLLNQGRKVVTSNYEFGSPNPFYSFVISGDYTFPNSFYIHAEVLHNSIGAVKSTAIFQKEALNFGLLTPAKWSIYQEFAYDITPLMRGSIFGIFNPNDKSFVIVPSVSYSVFTNWDLYLIGLFFHGEPLTEYGSYGTSVFIRVKWSF